MIPNVFFFLSALLHNHLVFGDLPIGTSRQISFSLANHSPSSVYRFEMPSVEGLVFSPSVGHLHPRTSKEITLTLSSPTKLAMNRSAIEVDLVTIAFSLPLAQVHTANVFVHLHETAESVRNCFGVGWGKRHENMADETIYPHVYV